MGMLINDDFIYTLLLEVDYSVIALDEHDCSCTIKKFREQYKLLRPRYNLLRNQTAVFRKQSGQYGSDFSYYKKKQRFYRNLRMTLSNDDRSTEDICWKVKQGKVVIEQPSFVL